MGRRGALARRGLLSGALRRRNVATQRAFVMVAIVLVGVLVDRPALTFRTLSYRRLGDPDFGAAGAS